MPVKVTTDVRSAWSDYEITYEGHKPGHGSYVVRSAWSHRVVWGPGTYAECERWIAGRS